MVKIVSTVHVPNLIPPRKFGRTRRGARAARRPVGAGSGRTSDVVGLVFSQRAACSRRAQPGTQAGGRDQPGGEPLRNGNPVPPSRRPD